MLNNLELKDWMAFNAKLQNKKSALRHDLAERGILKRGGTNTYDKYKYFTEAQYKELFTELFSKHHLELKFDELDYLTFEGTEKMNNGRLAKVRYALIDTETGFYETTDITGEGLDKGDKAGYKAYTGTLKYYLANTFMVATGDNAEAESPNEKINTRDKVGSASKKAKSASKKEDTTSRDAFIARARKLGVNVVDVAKQAGFIEGALTEEIIAKANIILDEVEESHAEDSNRG